jgi:hypothetical protein
MDIKNYINSATKQFQYYKSLGEKTFEQLSDEQLLWKANEESNSIAIIVKHLWGNMLSRWTDFLTTDGEKIWRQREAEFDNDITSRDEIIQKWNEGWTCLFSALQSINEDNFHSTIYIRNEKHTISDAVNRQLCHYAYHVGQIVYIGKMLNNETWTSLSIPRGGTEMFNAKKFSENKT